MPHRSHPPIRPAAWALAATALAVLTACSTTRVSPGGTLSDLETLGRNGSTGKATTVLEAAVEVFVAALAESSAARSGTEQEAAQRAFGKGIAMLDLQCQRYLDGVGLANQAAGYERQQTTMTGSLLAALMGLTGSPSKHVAGVAAGFGFAGSSMDAFTSAYLFSDAASSVTLVVRRSQEAYLAKVDADGGPASHAGMVALLVGYEALCRPPQIRALIDAAIAKSEIQADFDRPRVSDAETATTLAALAQALGAPVSEAEAIVLYAWYLNPDERDKGAKLSEQAAVQRFLPPGASGAEGAAELAKKLQRAFLSTQIAGSRVPQRWRAAVQSLLDPAQEKSAAGDGKLQAGARVVRVPALSVR